MMPASYQFAGLDSEMIELTQELEELGGGDAKSVSMELHYLIRLNDEDDEKNQTLWSHDHSLGLRDIHAKDTSESKSMRYYSTSSSSSAFQHESFLSTDSINTVVEDATTWLTKGFNNCILNIGPTMTGKTDTMFGNLGLIDNHNDADVCVSSQILRSLFHQKERATSDTEYRIGLSAWSFDGQRNIDLLVRIAETNLPLEFAIVECPTIDIALQLLNEARRRCQGASSANPQYSRSRRSEEEKCHFFARVMLFQRDLHAIDRGTASIHTGITSSLYFIDLLGFADIEGNYYKTLPNKDKIIVRNRNLQLQSLLQLIQEMASICRNALQYPSRPMEHMKRYAKLMETKALTSARSSKLSKLIAPIIQGNTRTVILGYVEDGKDQFEHTRDLITQLQYVPEVRCAVYRMEEIPFHDLKYKSHLSVLGPKYDQKVSSQRLSMKHNSNQANASGLIFTSNAREPVYEPNERIAEQFETLAFAGRNVSNNPNNYFAANNLQANNSLLETEAAQKKRISAQEINLTNLLEDECDLTNFDRTPQSGSSHSRRTIDLSSKDDSTASHHLVEDIQRLVPADHHVSAATTNQKPISAAYEAPKPLTYSSNTGHNNSLNASALSTTSSIQHLMSEFHSLMTVVENQTRHQPVSSTGTTTNDDKNDPARSQPPISVQQASVGRLPQEPIRTWPDHHYFPTNNASTTSNNHAAGGMLPLRQSVSPLRTPAVAERSSSSHQQNPTTNATTNSSSNKYMDLVQESQRLLQQHQQESRSLSQSFPPPTNNNSNSLAFPASLVTSLEQPVSAYNNTNNSNYNGQVHVLDDSSRVPQYKQPPRLWSAAHDDLFAQIPMGIGAQTAVPGTTAAPHMYNNNSNDTYTEHNSEHNKDIDNVRYTRVKSAAEDILLRRSSRSNSPSATAHAHTSSHASSPPRQIASLRMRHQQRKPNQHFTAATGNTSTKADSSEPEEEDDDRSEKYVQNTSTARRRSSDRQQKKATKKVRKASSSISLLKKSKKYEELSPSPSSSSASESDRSQNSDDDSDDGNNSGSEDGESQNSDHDGNYSNSDRSESDGENRHKRTNNHQRKKNKTSHRNENDEKDTLSKEDMPSSISSNGDGSHQHHHNISRISKPITRQDKRHIQKTQKSRNVKDDESDSEVRVSRHFQDDHIPSSPILTKRPPRTLPSEHDNVARQSLNTENALRSSNNNTMSNTNNDTDIVNTSRHNTSMANAGSTTVGMNNNSGNSATNNNNNNIPNILAKSMEDMTLRAALSAAEENMETLTRVNESLILALQNEKAHRMRLEKENQQMRDGYVEVHAQHEVEIDSLRYHVHHLKAQVKKLCEQGACLDIFETFEKDVQRLARENEVLRDANLKLEWQVTQTETKMEDVEVDVISLSDIANVHSVEEKEFLERQRRLQQQWNRNASKQRTLMERLKASGKERETWKQEFEKLKVKERQFIVAERMKEDSSHRLKKAFYDLQTLKKTSDQQSLRMLEMERENNVLKHDLEQYQKSDALLRAERDRLLSEVAELRTKMRFFEAEEQRVAKLNKFVSKHSTRPASSSSNSSGNTYNHHHASVTAAFAASTANHSGTNNSSGINMSGGNTATVRRLADRVPVRQYSQPQPPSPPPLPQSPHLSQSQTATKQQMHKQQSTSRQSGSSNKRTSEIETKTWDSEAAIIEDSISQHTPSLLPMFQQLAANVRYK